ncbi:MAG: DUF2911 domain-containing protein [Chitinophagales bacterium]
MKKTILIKGFVLALTGIFLSSITWAQNARQSPPATTYGKVNGATIIIKYSSPAVKGRKIWGGLVPYDKVWRAGANEATLFTTDRAILVEGKSLPAGNYSLYAIPGENEWIIIFNSAIGQWGIKTDGSGATTQDPAKDVLRVTVKPEISTEFNERLTYMVNVNGFALYWENLQVPVSIK